MSRFGLNGGFMQPNSPATSLKTADHEDALAAVCDRDPEGFKHLHAEFFNLVMSTAYKVLNNRQDAEDVTQEVFASLWKKAHLYDSKRGKVSTWLSTLARNRAIDRLRSKQRRAQLQEDVERDTNPEMLREKDDVLSGVSKIEESAIVRSAVLKLRPEQREAIEMTFFNGYSQSEAAEKLGAPLGTVKARVRRGLIQLRNTVPRLINQSV